MKTYYAVLMLVVLAAWTFAGCDSQTVSAEGENAEYVYTVQEGETGWTVAEKVYGDERYWDYIADANPGVDVESLAAGQQLIVPTFEEGGEVTVPVGCDRKNVY